MGLGFLFAGTEPRHLAGCRASTNALAGLHHCRSRANERICLALLESLQTHTATASWPLITARFSLPPPGIACKARNWCIEEGCVSHRCTFEPEVNVFSGKPAPALVYRSPTEPSRDVYASGSEAALRPIINLVISRLLPYAEQELHTKTNNSHAQSAHL